jgi:hypothetical protein
MYSKGIAFSKVNAGLKVSHYKSLLALKPQQLSGSAEQLT